MTPLLPLVCVLSLSAMAANPPDARDLIRRAVAGELESASQSRDYTWIVDTRHTRFDRSGRQISVESSTSETLILYGKQFSRTIGRDGKPLHGDEDRKERVRFEREVAKRAALTPERRLREDAAERDRDRKAREFLLQLPELFRFTLKGEETIGSRPAWIVDAQPLPGARPKGIAASNLSKLFGRLWIDKAEGRWVKGQAEVRDTLRFGLFLGSLGPGSLIEFERIRMEDGAWLPARAAGRLKARLAVKKFNIADETFYRDYKRFTSDARILPDGSQ